MGWTVSSEELKAKPVVTPRYPFERIPQLPSRPASLGPMLFTTWVSSSRPNKPYYRVFNVLQFCKR